MSVGSVTFYGMYVSYDINIRRLPSELLFAVSAARMTILNISGKKMLTLILYIRIHRIHLR